MVVSHNLNDVFEVADRIAVLYLGRMVAVDEASKFDRQVGGRVHDHRAVGTQTPGGRGRRRFQPAGI